MLSRKPVSFSVMRGFSFAAFLVASTVSVEEIPKADLILLIEVFIPIQYRPNNVKLLHFYFTENGSKMQKKGGHNNPVPEPKIDFDH